MATATTEIYTLSLHTLFRSVEMGLTPSERAHQPGFVPGRVGRVQSRSKTGAPSPKDLRIFLKCRDPSAKAHLSDRKSTRLNSSHEWTSYAGFCLKKKQIKRI